MIRALRIRLIVITMLLASIVLAVTFTVQIVSSQNRMTSESLRSLDVQYSRLVQSGHYNDSPNPVILNFNPRDKPFDGDSAFSTFFVTIDSAGAIISIDDFSRELTDETAQSAVSLATDQDRQTGTISSLSLRFNSYDNGDGTNSIGFIDISFERNFIRQQLINYALIGLGSLVAFFLISLLLSAVAVRPVRKAWQQQQQFVADASHELKTPITVMLANTSILLSGKLKDRKDELKWITYIDHEARRMKKLVEDLLFLARSDAGKQVVLHDSIFLSDIISESTLLFEAVLFEAGRRLDAQIDEDIRISGDQGQIRQLIDILLDNAAKHALPDTIIRVRLYRENNKACLTVNNASDPIPEEDLAHIFDRFFRIDQARTRAQGSYGLGLAIASKIVDSHHGKISVESDSAHGITFKVSFPLSS